MFDKRFAVSALTLGNFIVGLSILLPTGMLVDLSIDLNVPVGTVGLLITLVPAPCAYHLPSSLGSRADLTDAHC